MNRVIHIHHLFFIEIYFHVSFTGDCELHVPDVPELVQKMLEDLYNVVIHHQVSSTIFIKHNLVIFTSNNN